MLEYILRKYRNDKKYDLLVMEIDLFLKSDNFHFDDLIKSSASVLSKGWLRVNSLYSRLIVSIPISWL